MTPQRNVALLSAIAADGRPFFELAGLCKINQTTFTAIKSGRRTATAVQRKAIADVLGLPETDLFAEAVTS